MNDWTYLADLLQRDPIDPGLRKLAGNSDLYRRMEALETRMDLVESRLDALENQ